MRSFINNILNFIGTSSLTDLEWESVDESIGSVLNQASYDQISEILEAREAVSTYQDRLLSFYQAKGVELTQNSTAQTNIFIGAVLD